MFADWQNVTKRRALLMGFLGGVGVTALVYGLFSISTCASKYPLLNPEIGCEDPAMLGEWHYDDLRNALLRTKAGLKESGKITHVSIYFRDLKNGPRFGIGEYDDFQPASLLKLPVLIAFLHEADRDPSILDQTLSYEGVLNVNMNVETSEETILPNTPYPIRDLLRKMTVHSDNYSYKILTEELNRRPGVTAYHTFLDLDILPMMTAPKADYISIQTYASLFAALYNTGYLSKQMSQLALEMLSDATFRDGLVAGVPSSVRVAHKFGYRILSENDTQLHDCGIVYHPALPYVLCVMTSGTTLVKEQEAIAEISREVFDHVAQQASTH